MWPLFRYETIVWSDDHKSFSRKHRACSARHLSFSVKELFVLFTNITPWISGMMVVLDSLVRLTGFRSLWSSALQWERPSLPVEKDTVFSPSITRKAGSWSEIISTLHPGMFIMCFKDKMFTSESGLWYTCREMKFTSAMCWYESDPYWCEWVVVLPHAGTS